jgi:hypothetical protein
MRTALGDASRVVIGMPWETNHLQSKGWDRRHGVDAAICLCKIEMRTSGRWLLGGGREVGKMKQSLLVLLKLLGANLMILCLAA